MKTVRLDAIARSHMREIHRFGAERWGTAQADKYLRQLSARFEEIARGIAHSRLIPPRFAIEGRFCKYESHFIYWRPIGDEAIAIVAVLHQRMHQRERVKSAFSNSR